VRFEVEKFPWRCYLDGLVTTLVLPATDEVQDQDDDHQNGQGCPDRNGNYVVGDLVRFTSLHETKVPIFFRVHEWLNLEVDSVHGNITASAGQVEDDL